MTAEPRPLCTTPEALWCPNHGRCTCHLPESYEDPGCPLHAPGSDHAEEAPLPRGLGGHSRVPRGKREDLAE